CPISAATLRTFSTLALSSVSGIVKNWGAWGSIAPPITVDCMVQTPSRDKAIAQWAGQQAALASQATKEALAFDVPPALSPNILKEHSWPSYPSRSHAATTTAPRRSSTAA